MGMSADKTDWVDCLAELAEALTRRGWHLVTAESCTGGWIAKCCTDRPGSSTWYEGGVVSYSNALKTSLLGVRPATLARDGAVSEATVREMAQGALTRLGGDVAIAVSGIAGPGGATSGKPVGTVWFAWAGPGLRLDTRCAHFPGDREAVRTAAVGVALTGLCDLLRVAPPDGAWA